MGVTFIIIRCSSEPLGHIIDDNVTVIHLTILCNPTLKLASHGLPVLGGCDNLVQTAYTVDTHTTLATVSELALQLFKQSCSRTTKF